MEAQACPAPEMSEEIARAAGMKNGAESGGNKDRLSGRKKMLFLSVGAVAAVGGAAVLLMFAWPGNAGKNEKSQILPQAEESQQSEESRQTEESQEVVTHEEKEYFLVDKNGNILYQGSDEVKASGGMYITLHSGYESDTLGYHRLDGSLAFSLECESGVTHINSFYDGISSVYDSLGASSVTVEMSAGAEKGPREEDVPSRIGAVDSRGEVSWMDDSAYYACWDSINEKIEQEAQYTENGSVHANVTSASSYMPWHPLSTVNHGYYVTENMYEWGYIKVYEESGRLAADLNFCNFTIDGDGNITLDENVYDENNTYYGCYVDGGYLWNYGSHMVFGIQGKNVQVDFQKMTARATAWTQGRSLRRSMIISEWQMRNTGSYSPAISGAISTGTEMRWASSRMPAIFRTAMP